MDRDRRQGALVIRRHRLVPLKIQTNMAATSAQGAGSSQQYGSDLLFVEQALYTAVFGRFRASCFLTGSFQ